MNNEQVGDREGAQDSGWDEHRRQQLKRWLTTTPAARLAWLERAIELAGSVRALPSSARNRDPDHGS